MSLVKHFPHTWIPKWDSSGNEVKGYVDPSARTLGAYKKNKSCKNIISM